VIAVKRTITIVDRLLLSTFEKIRPVFKNNYKYDKFKNHYCQYETAVNVPFFTKFIKDDKFVAGEDQIG